MKKCANCFLMLPYSDFYKKLNSLQYSCKKCTKEKVYSWRKEKILKRWDIIFNGTSK